MPHGGDESTEPVCVSENEAKFKTPKMVSHNAEYKKELKHFLLLYPKWILKNDTLPNRGVKSQDSGYP